MAEDSSELAALRAQIDEMGAAILSLSDAVFGIGAVIGRAISDAGIIDRERLADALEVRAGNPGAADHNAPLRAFARAIRMNLPGGRFEVIDGGKPEGS